MDSGFLHALMATSHPLVRVQAIPVPLPEALAFGTSGVIEIMEDVALLREGDPGMNYSLAHSRTSLYSRPFCIDRNVLLYYTIAPGPVWLV